MEMMSFQNQKSNLLQDYIKVASDNKFFATPNFAEKNPSVEGFDASLEELNSDCYTPEKIKTKKETKKAKIAKIALLASVGLVALGGATASFRKYGGIKNTFSKVKNHTDELFKEGGKINEALQESAKFQDGANNITNGKDSFVRHYLLKFPGYEKFDNFTSDLYKKIMSNTLVKSYSKATNSFLNASKEAEEAVLKVKGIDSETSSRLMELLQKKGEKIKHFCSEKEVRERISTVNSSMTRLDIDGWSQLEQTVKGGNLKENIKNLSTESIVAKRMKATARLQSDILAPFQNGGLTNTEAKELENIVNLISEKDGGKIKELLSGADKAYNKAFKQESVDLLQKLRDVNCGSAPTDIETIALTAGTLGVYTAQADTKEEKVGTILTTGIPLTVSLGSTVLATCKMISGAKALGLGLVTGFIANKIGGFINNKYQTAHNTQNQPRTIETLDDYKDKVVKHLV